MYFYDVAYEKDNIKISFSLSRKICIFRKGLTHDFGQKFEISF